MGINFPCADPYPHPQTHKHERPTLLLFRHPISQGWDTPTAAEQPSLLNTGSSTARATSNEQHSSRSRSGSAVSPADSVLVGGEGHRSSETSVMTTGTGDGPTTAVSDQHECLQPGHHSFAAPDSPYATQSGQRASEGARGQAEAVGVHSAGVAHPPTQAHSPTHGRGSDTSRAGQQGMSRCVVKLDLLSSSLCFL